jgi:hypothetical protein
MTKKDYERAARIIQYRRSGDKDTDGRLVGTFVTFFMDDNPRFDEVRFRAACVPGANVKARGKAVA